jgi:hypothetical protein
MWDGAKITNNNLLVSQTSKSSDYTDVRYGSIAAVVIGDTSTTNSSALQFTMHGGEISNTNYRGVALKGIATLQCTFTMKNGLITNNGTVALSGTTYPYGGGVFFQGGYINFYMEGGEISNNGCDGNPGSGIFTNGTTANTSFVLNGPVVIKNNSLAFRAVETLYTGIAMGPNFSTTSDPFVIDLCNTGTTLNRNNLISNWTGKQLLLAQNSGGQAITFDSNALAEQFVLTNYFKAATSGTGLPEKYSDISGSISQYGVVTLVDDNN